MVDTQTAYDELIQRYQEIFHLNNISELLNWDQEVIMPKGGSEQRAEQTATLHTIIHHKKTDPRIGELLERLSSSHENLSLEEKANYREAKRDYQRATLVPASLVAALARESVISMDYWMAARKEKQFKTFQASLEKLVALKIEYADAIRGDRPRYDALLDEYEPDETSAQVKALFEALRPALTTQLRTIQASAHPTTTDPLKADFPFEKQKAYCKSLLEKIGYNFQEGRLDESAHPFCSGTGSDVRITTRYQPTSVDESIFGCLHEAGHALYEQGLHRGRLGQPAGSYASLGLHESQSRLWENFLGRSKAFWHSEYANLQTHFPTPFASLSLEDFWRSVNHVSPSFIRTEADEVTYNLHIILRFEIETALIERRLLPRDLPDAWNEQFKRDFDLAPPDDSLGCLQDIHWASGHLGYFPTYTLGNLYAAQFYQKLQSEFDLEETMKRGEFLQIRMWLKEHIHQQGRLYPARELVQKVTGTPPSEKPFIEYLHNKFSQVYSY